MKVIKVVSGSLTRPLSWSSLVQLERVLCRYTSSRREVMEARKVMDSF